MRHDEFYEPESPFASFVRQRSPRRGPVLAGIALALAIIAAAFWYLRRPGTEPGPASADMPADTARAPASAALDSVPPLDLPALDTSDAFIRRFAGQLSAHPQIARWLVSDELVRRFVTTIADLASGMSPRPHLRFMEPQGEFSVQDTGGRIVVDPASYRRYDLMAETFASLDTRGTATLLRQLHPLFVEAHRELGLPDRTFDGDLRAAISTVLTTPVLDTPLEVRRVEAAYTFVDPVHENRPSAQKHLIRMGPQNARRVQEKLAAIAAAMGLSLN